MNTEIWFVISACFLKFSLSQRCDLSKIKEQEGFDESKSFGLWYQVRWYPEPNKTVDMELWDFSANMGLHPTKNDTVLWKFNGREKGELDPVCLTPFQGDRVRVRPGYYLTPAFVQWPEGELWIVYTDYYNFMVYFICYEKKQNNCTRPEVAFMSRTQKPRLEDLRKGQELIEVLCVKPKAFLDKIQEVDCVQPPKIDRKPQSDCAQQSSRHSRYCDRIWGSRCSRWRHYLYNCRSRYSCRRYRYLLDHCHDHWDDCYHH